MAPEISAAYSDKIPSAHYIWSADIFSLGVVCFEMFKGRLMVEAGKFLSILTRHLLLRTVQQKANIHLFSLGVRVLSLKFPEDRDLIFLILKSFS